MSLTREWLNATVGAARADYDAWVAAHPGEDPAADPLTDALWTLAVAASRVLAALPPPPSQIEEDRALVRRLLAIEEGLTEWEESFVESISRWVDHSPLTDAQRARALQIDGRTS